MNRRELQAEVRREKAMRAARTRRLRAATYTAAVRLPFHHVIETCIETGVIPASAQGVYRRLMSLGHDVPPRAVLTALRRLNDYLTPRPSVDVGWQWIEGVVLGEETFAGSYDRERTVVWVRTACGHELYGTPPAPGLTAGESVRFYAEVRPGLYKWWSPRLTSQRPSVLKRRKYNRDNNL